MGKFIEDMKNKNQDLFINLVSCGKSFDEPSGNDQGKARNVPLGDDLGLKKYVSPSDNAQGQGHMVVIEPETNTQPTINVPPEEENTDQQQGQELDESSGNSQEQNQEQEEEENEDDIDQPLPKGARAKVSRPPGKRPAPTPGTG